MIRFSIFLPKHRVVIAVTKTRQNLKSPGPLKQALAARSGSKISRFFRCLFEKSKIKTFLGTNLAMAVFASSFVSPKIDVLANTTPELATLNTGTVELVTKSSVRMPLGEVKITQGYHLFHSGIDLDGMTGDPVYPIMRGQVEALINERWGLGKHIIINHGSGLKSVYGHLSSFKVKAGEEVDGQRIIGLVGNTGQSFGDHLHLEVWENNRPINPLTVLPIR